MRCETRHPKWGQCILEKDHTGSHEIDPKEREAHKCHARNCPTNIKSTLLMCAKHWKMVPKEIQDEIYNTYRKGQCTTKTPSREWHSAANKAIKYVFETEKDLK